MKKLLILLALCMVLSVVLVACTEDPAGPEETTPEVTTPEDTTPEDTTPEDTTPEDTTPEDTTPEDTTPEDTTPGEEQPPEPVKVVYGKSWDSLTKVPSGETIFKDGYEYMDWENNAVAEVGLNDAALHVYGWVAYATETEGTVGYKINDGEVVYGAGFTSTAESGVQDHIHANVPGANSACRMHFDIPVADLAAGEYTVGLYAKDPDGNEELIKEFKLTKTLPFVEMAAVTGYVGWSFDTVFLNGQMYFEQDGGAAGKLDAIGKTIAIPYGTAHNSLKERGWIGFGQDIEAFGYYIAGASGELVFDESFYVSVPEGDPVKGAGGQYAQRFEITVPMDTLTQGTYRIGIVVKLVDGTVARMYETIVVIPPENLVDTPVTLGVREGGAFGAAKQMGQKLPLGEYYLKQITVAGMATYSDSVNTWGFKIWAWNTDYATTVAGTPLFETAGENHADNQDFVIDIPIELLITGDVYYEIAYLTGATNFTGWTAAEILVPGVESYINGAFQEGTYGSSVVIAAPGTPSEEPEEPEDPGYIAVGDANYLNQMVNTATTNQTTGEVKEDGAYITLLSGVPAEGQLVDPNFWVLPDGSGIPGVKFLGMKYRTTAEGTFEFFIGSADIKGDGTDNKRYDYVANGEWQVIIIDLAEFAAVNADGLVDYLRFDYYCGDQTGYTVDVANIALFKSAADAYAFYGMEAPEEPAPEEPEDPSAEPLVIDFQNIDDSDIQEFTAAQFSQKVIYGNYGTVVNLGQYDLSLYSKAIIKYATDSGYKTDGLAQIGFKSSSATWGQAGSFDGTDIIASAPMTDAVPDTFWALTGLREAEIDLSSVDYNGDVWVGAYNVEGQIYAIESITLIP